MKLQPAGDAALLVTLGSEIDHQVNWRVHALAQALLSLNKPGMIEVIPGYCTLLVAYDPLVTSYEEAAGWMRQADGMQAEVVFHSRQVEIPVVYGGEQGPDLPFVARHAGLSEARVIAIHTAGEYPVYMMGFTPGFPYLGGLDPRIAAPRLETPRKLVPAGSVGIAGIQTGVYPIDSPGGWRIIGRTDLKLFDPASDPPFLLAPGDVVKFTRA